MSAIVRETSEYVEMSDSITLCIVKDGAAGTSINMKTGVSSPDALPSSGASVGDSYIIDGHLWTYTGGTASDATHRYGFTDCGKVSGEAGKNNYVHVAWSNKQPPLAKDDIVLSNTDGNAYAYMGTWVSETKEDTVDEAFNMAKWVYVKGDKGEDGSAYDIYLSASVLKGDSTGKLNGNDAVSVTAKVVKITGGTAVQVTDKSEAYFTISRTDDRGDLIDWPSGSFTVKTFNAFGQGVKTWNFALYVGGTFLKTVMLPVVRDGKQGADGKGALEIICDPETIVIDTDDNGLVNDTSNAWAALMCMRDGKEVSGVTYEINKTDKNSTVNCDATVNNNGIVTITSVTSQSVTIGGNTVTVSCTSGSVTVSVYDPTTKTTYAKTVPFTVNVAKFNGGLKADNKRLESKYSELTNNGSITDLTEYRSKILQSAREISMHVSEKRAGRRNLLVGSAFRKNDGVPSINSATIRIGINDGYEGTNCLHVENTYSGSGEGHYFGAFWDGSQGASSVKIKRGKKYTLSCWAKCDNENATITLEAIYTDKQTSAKRTTRPMSSTYSFKVSKANEWQLLQCVKDTSLCWDGSVNTQYDYMAVNVYCYHTLTDGNGVTVNAWLCRPMLEEGKEYNGWTLSEQDYDYVGGNLLDGTATLAKTGNVETLNPDNVTQGGMGESASIKAVLSPTIKENDFLQFSTDGMGLKANEDYVLSFYAKTDSYPGRLQCYLYPSEGNINTEDSEGGYDNTRNPSDEDLRYGIVPGKQWKRYWVHWRPTKNDPKHVLFRLQRGGNDRGTYSSYTTYAVDDVVLYDGTYYRCIMAGQGNTPSSSSSYWKATYYEISLSQPKLEVGATMTEWTAKRSDMVDKQALYATGIDIKNRKIIATADNFIVRNNSGTPTFSIDEDGNIVGVGGASFNGPMKATTFTLNSTYFSVKEDGTITAKGGQISFFNFDTEGMASAVEYDSSQNKPWRGIGLSSDNISVSGYTGQRISSVFLGKGLIDSRFAGSDKNYTVHRVGSTSLASTFYNYIKLERFEDGHDSYENDPEYAALGIETQGDFCLAALGGPSLFAGMCFASNTGGSFSADKKHCFYLCSGGTFKMPSDPPDGMLIVVIQKTGSRINFNGNGHRFQSGTYNSLSFTSDSAGQWSLFYYNNEVWYTIYMTR